MKKIIKVELNRELIPYIEPWEEDMFDLENKLIRANARAKKWKKEAKLNYRVGVRAVGEVQKVGRELYYLCWGYLYVALIFLGGFIYLVLTNI